MERLLEILDTMDVPTDRFNGLTHNDKEVVRWHMDWLRKNLGMKNSDHLYFHEAKALIKLWLFENKD